MLCQDTLEKYTYAKLPFEKAHKISLFLQHKTH